MAGLFREGAEDRISSVDRLDLYVRAPRLSWGLVALAAALVAVAAVVWACLGSVWGGL